MQSASPRGDQLMGAVLNRLRQHRKQREERAARRADLRQRWIKIELALARLEASYALDAWQRANPTTNGHREAAPGDGNETMIDAPQRSGREQGGQRRPAGTLRGVSFYDSDEGAAWDF
jgi:hypothetical protein